VAAVFTTWSDLHAQLLNDYAELVAGGALRYADYAIETGTGSRKVSYRSGEELLRQIDHAATMAAMTSDTLRLRTCAVPAR
jgi:hypothetical protein